MEYYNLNIKQIKDPRNPKGDKGERISWASRCLDKSNKEFLFKKMEDKRPRAPIFYGLSTVDQILSSTEHRLGEARKFCEIGQPDALWEDATIVTIDEGMVWIYRPCGPIETHPHTEIEGLPDWNSMKCFPVTIVDCLKQRDVPLILASQRSNRHFSSGTFTRISEERYAGNIFALDRLQKIKKRPPAPLDCLSSLEFETLIAKVFEEAGCFVPAYKGGFMAGIDLIACNDGSVPIDVQGLVVPPGQKISLQLKLRSMDLEADRGQADYLIVNQPLAPMPKWCFDRAWFDSCLKVFPGTQKWLDRSTEWTRY